MDKFFTKLHDAIDNFFVRWEVITGLHPKQYTIKGYTFTMNWPLIVFGLGATGVLFLCIGLFGGWGLLVFAWLLYTLDRYAR